MPVAGIKRKTPPPSSISQSSHPPPGPPVAEKASQNATGAANTPSNSKPSDNSPSTESPSEESDAPMDPGPQPWPNLIGSRPTLTGGLGGMPLILCEFIVKITDPSNNLIRTMYLSATPSHLSFPQVDTEVLEAFLLPPASTTTLDPAQRKESQSAPSGPGTGSKKTVREIVGSVDPRVRVDGDVEDVSILAVSHQTPSNSFNCAHIDLILISSCWS